MDKIAKSVIKDWVASNGIILIPMFIKIRALLKKLLY
jgi:hypothetical protein